MILCSIRRYRSKFNEDLALSRGLQDKHAAFIIRVFFTATIITNENRVSFVNLLNEIIRGM